MNGNQPTRENLWKFAYIYNLLRPQPGLRVMLQSPGGAPRQLDLEARVRERYRIADLTGSDGGGDIWQLIREAQNDAERYRARYITWGEDLVVWKLPQFTKASVADGIKRLRGKKGLILDLRGNSGGSVSSLLDLVGRFTAEDVVIGSLSRRSGKSPLVARGKGTGAFTGELIVLVDSRSASAAELFARTVQMTKRGRVIGDRTAGDVMVSRWRGHAMGAETVVFYNTSVTVADLVLADGSRLEKVGVVPDVLAIPTSLDLAQKRDPVLSHAAQQLGVPITPEKAWLLIHATNLLPGLTNIPTLVVSAEQNITAPHGVILQNPELAKFLLANNALLQKRTAISAEHGHLRRASRGIALTRMVVTIMRVRALVSGMMGFRRISGGVMPRPGTS